MAPDSRMRFALVVAALVVVAAGVRVVPAVRQSLWLDEVVSARIVTQPSVPDAVTRVRKTESSPPGWHLLNWALWRAVGRPRVEWLRLLSVLCGAALAGLTCWYASWIGLRRSSSLIAGVLAATGPNVVAHGAELRPYALLTLLSLVLVIAVERAARAPTRRNLALLAATVFVGSYTHYFFLLAVAVAAGWTLLRAPRPSRFRLLGAVGLALLPFLVWLPDFRFQYRHNLYAYNGSFNARAVAYSYARIIGVFGSTSAAAGLVRLALGLVVLWGAYLLARLRRTELVGAMAVLPVAISAFIWLLGPHIFNERNLLISMPFAGLAIGRATEGLSLRPAAALAGAVGVIVLVSLWQWEFDYGRSCYSGIARALVREGWTPRDDILQFGPAPLGLSQPVGWYLPRHPHLIGGRLVACGQRLFAVSYDPGPGARWIRAHVAPGAPAEAFTAFDHTPRGPKAATPIVVARVRPGVSSARAGIAAGGRLLVRAGRRGCAHA